MVVFSTTISAFYEQFESRVRSYCRNYPKEFDRARDSHLFDSQGKKYLDFLSGCGALNYGHNDASIKKALLDYVLSDGLAMGLDFHCSAKTAFLSALNEHILRPRSLDFRAQFTGPTGANAVEAALKLARKHTGRSGVVAFTNAFHGVSIGALAATGNMRNRSSSEGQLHNIHRAPFDGYMGDGVDTADLLERMLSDPSSGLAPPAAILYEPIQGDCQAARRARHRRRDPGRLWSQRRFLRL
jgi:diaminobutyrate-2-oxoglutarate transaminase